MNAFAHIPLWVSIIVALFLVIGSTLTLLGAFGLVRVRSFYDRLHVPTLGSSWGTAAILIASMLLYSVSAGRVILHELIIGIFVMVTTPVTLMLLGRAALHRDGIPLLEPEADVLRDEVPQDKESDDDEEDPAADDLEYEPAKTS